MSGLVLNVKTGEVVSPQEYAVDGIQQDALEPDSLLRQDPVIEGDPGPNMMDTDGGGGKGGKMASVGKLFVMWQFGSRFLETVTSFGAFGVLAAKYKERMESKVVYWAAMAFTGIRAWFSLSFWVTLANKKAGRIMNFAFNQTDSVWLTQFATTSNSFWYFQVLWAAMEGYIGYSAYLDPNNLAGPLAPKASGMGSRAFGGGSTGATSIL
jgi:hypothetical protein